MGTPEVEVILEKVDPQADTIEDGQLRQDLKSVFSRAGRINTSLEAETQFRQALIDVGYIDGDT